VSIHLRTDFLCLFPVLVLVACTPISEAPRPSKLDVFVPPRDVIEMRAIGPNVYVVECADGMPTLPPGITPTKPLGWPQTHPGYHVLSDGTCVFDPDPSAVPYSPVPVN
jgi:hypothetical protein